MVIRIFFLFLYFFGLVNVISLIFFKIDTGIFDFNLPLSVFSLNIVIAACFVVVILKNENQFINDQISKKLAYLTKKEGEIGGYLRDCIYYFLLKNKDLTVENLFLLLKEIEKIYTEEKIGNRPLFACQDWELEIGYSDETTSDFFILNKSHLPIIQFFKDTFHKKHEGKISEKNLVKFHLKTDQSLYYEFKMNYFLKKFCLEK